MSFEGGRGDNLSGAPERDCLIYSSFMHAQDTACATCCFRPGALLQTRGAACCKENSCAAQHTYNHVMFSVCDWVVSLCVRVSLWVLL